MINLAGNQNCDGVIEQELKRSGIEIIQRDARFDSEVPASIFGKLGPFIFTRAWHYWIVEGWTPLNVAEELYKDAVGRTDIRVAGHCGCPPPEKPWIVWKTTGNHAVLSISAEIKFINLIKDNPSLTDILTDIYNQFVFSDGPALIGAKPYIENYHIDTEIGLRLFADTIRKYGLDKTN
jgi:hypothetical protein